jgi:hypothetical protein
MSQITRTESATQKIQRRETGERKRKRKRKKKRGWRL